MLKQTTRRAMMTAIPRRAAGSPGSPVRAPGYLALLAIVACDGGAAPPDAAPTSTETGNAALALEEITRDVAALESKFLALAEVLSEEQYAWRPTEDVRSSAEVFMHVAAVNLAFPMLTGFDAPRDAAMSEDDFFPSIAAYERSAEGKEAVLAALRSSFEHLRRGVEASATDLDREVDVLGQMRSSVRGFWWVHSGHIHEHLGQLVAYARSMGVAPPWS